MKKLRFFSDRFPRQTLEHMAWLSEIHSKQIPLATGYVRVWIEQDVPEDADLWPDRHVEVKKVE